LFLLIRLKNGTAFITISRGYFPVCLQTVCPKKLKGRKYSQGPKFLPQSQVKVKPQNRYQKYDKNAFETSLKFIFQNTIKMPSKLL